MTFRNPSYITRTKHGVYYFQARIPKYFADRAGIKGRLIRKSLRTKNRKLALSIASRLWSKLYLIVYVGESVVGNKTGKDQLEDLLNKEDFLADYSEQSRIIKIALRITDEYGEIPDWDADGREIFFDSLSHQEREALEYVAREAIDLDEYRVKAVSNKPPPTQQISSVTTGLKSKPLDQLLELWLDDKKVDNIKEKSINNYRPQVSVLILFLGNKNSAEVSTEDLQEFKTALSKLPAHYQNRYGHMEIRDVLEMDIDKSELLSESSKADYAISIRSYLNWCVDRKYIDRDVLVVMKGAFSKNKVRKNHYLPFNTSDLQKLLLSTEYIGPKKHNKIWKYWLPIVGLFTGARQKEICQLEFDDLRTFTYKGNTNYYFDINQDADKELKTEASVRKVPLHPILLQLDFIGFVEYQKKRGVPSIFSLHKADNDSGKRAIAVSRWFNDRGNYKYKCGIESKKGAQKVFHSFRHTLVSTLYESNLSLPIEKIGDIVGHTHKTITGNTYVGRDRLSIEQRYEVIKLLEFDVDFSKVRDWKFFVRR